MIRNILVLTFAFLSGHAFSAEPICLTTIRTAHTEYLDNLRDKVLSKSGTAARKREARRIFELYAETEQSVLNAYIEKKRKSGDLGESDKRILTLYKDLNLIHYKFFSCELIRTPSIKRSDLIDRGMEFCKGVLSSNNIEAAGCLD